MRPQPLIRVRPYKDESPTSVLLRSSSLNGYRTPIKQLNQLKGFHSEVLSPSLLTIAGNPKQFELACEILNIDTTYLGLIKPEREHELSHANFYLGGIVARRKHISKTSRYCPECLNDKKYFRKIWDYELYTSCHEHGVSIVNECVECGKKIDWNRQYIDRCHCGAKLIQPTTAAEYTVASEMIFNIYTSQDTKQFDLMMDFSTALSQHYRISRDDPKVLNMSAMGVRKPRELGHALVREMSLMQDVIVHPVLSFQSFINHQNSRVQKIAEYATEYIPVDSRASMVTRNGGDALSRNLTAKLLGIKPLDVSTLIKYGLLQSLMTTPDGSYPVSKKSINDLVFRLASLEQDIDTPTMTFQEVICESHACYENYRLEDLVLKSLNGEFQVAYFSLKSPLRDSRIAVPELTRLPEKEVFPMVWIGDFSEFVGMHPNILRELIKTTKGVKHFTGKNIKVDSNRKYLTLRHAKILLDKLKKIHRGSNIYQVTAKDLPVTNVAVQIFNF